VAGREPGAKKKGEFVVSVNKRYSKAKPKPQRHFGGQRIHREGQIACEDLKRGAISGEKHILNQGAQNCDRERV